MLVFYFISDFKNIFMCAGILEPATGVYIVEERSVFLRCEIRTKTVKIVYTFIQYL